jgi:hypothetical protein
VGADHLARTGPSHVGDQLCGLGQYLAPLYTFGAFVPGVYVPDLENAGDPISGSSPLRAADGLFSPSLGAT